MLIASQRLMNIVIVGAGYVGLVSACCLAEAGNRVTCVDHDTRKLALLNAAKVPFHEPGLTELLADQLRNGRLSFENQIAHAMVGADIVFLAVGTPAQENGKANLENLLQCVRALADTAFDDCIVVVKSTVPVGTCDHIEDLLNRSRETHPDQPRVRVVSNPEFLAEGRAIEDFRHPERIVIGANDRHSATILAGLYAPFDPDGRRLMFMSRRSAEFSKYACNAMLAARISMMNELAAIAGGLNADMNAVISVLKRDPRIGAHYLQPGAGYGGSCLPKDLQALIHAAEAVGEPAYLLRSVQHVNREQVSRLLAAIRTHFQNRLSGRRIAVWGLSFKPGTDDVRAAPSLGLISKLLAEDTQVNAYDPVAIHATQHALNHPDLHYADSAMAACSNADALVVMVEWEEFRKPNWAEVAAAMRGRMVLDGRGIYDGEHLRRHGLEHCHLGVSACRPAKYSYVAASPSFSETLGSQPR